MNLFGPSRQPESQSEQIQDLRKPEASTHLSDVLKSGRHCLEHIANLCRTVDEQAVRLGRAQERCSKTISALEETKKAHQKELYRIERCEKHLRLGEQVETSLKPLLIRSTREVIAQVGRVAAAIPEIQKNFDAFVNSEADVLNDQPSLVQLWSIGSSLRTLNRIAVNRLERIAGRGEPVHSLRQFDGSELEQVAKDLAFSDAELMQIRTTLEKIFRVLERGRAASERIDEYRGFAQEFVDEVERLESSVAAVNEEARLLLETHNEQAHSLQQAGMIAGDIVDQIVKVVVPSKPTQRDLAMQARAALEDVRESSGDGRDREFTKRMQRAGALLQRLLEDLANTPQPAQPEALAEASILQMPKAERGAEIDERAQTRDEVAVRFGSPRDMAAVMAIEGKCFETPWHEEDFTAFLNKDRRFLWCAVMQNEVIGFVFGVDHEHNLEIISIAVDPAYQRCGVGARLMEKAMKDLVDHNKDSISLVVRERNTDAQLFFQKCGLRFIRTIQGYFTDSHEAAYQMEYRRAEE